MVVNPIQKITKSPCFFPVFFGTKWTDICLISIVFREGTNHLSDFFLQSSILLTSEGTLLSGGCRGGKSSGGCGSTFSKFSFWRTDWNASSSSVGWVNPSQSKLLRIWFRKNCQAPLSTIRWKVDMWVARIYTILYIIHAT